MSLPWHMNMRRRYRFFEDMVDIRYKIDVVLTSSRIIKSVVTGQAPVTLELRNTPGKKHKQTRGVHAYITADAVHASARKYEKMKLGVSLRCARSILVHTSHFSCLGKPTIPLATQKRLPGTIYIQYGALHSAG